jgi:hypothetical protein
MELSYCDLIADNLRKSILKATSDMDSSIIDVTPIVFDLDPEDGFMVSTKKTFHVMDRNEKTYNVTIEESK